MRNAYPNKENCEVDELVRYIKLAKNVKEKDRLLAIQMLWQGLTVLQVANCLCISDVSVYNWIHRFNSKGLDGLLTRARGGRPRRVSKEQVKNYLNVFEAPEKAGETHWTGKKFHLYLSKTLEVQLSYQRTLEYLHEHDYKLKYGRSWPRQPEGNEDKREQFLAEVEKLSTDPTVKLWYMDEAGFDGDPRPRRGWCKKGERKKIYRTQKHMRINISGMCCPETGEFFALEFPYSNRDSFQCFLNAANQEISKQADKQDYIVLDNASWHKVKSIDWGRFKVLFLPPYSPDMNPIERIWGYLKQNYFNGFCAENLEQLTSQIDFAICSIWDDPSIVMSITQKPEKLS